MITLKEIQELKDYLVNTYHHKRTTEQTTDQKYIDDTFDVPFVKEGVGIVRTGKGFRMVSNPAEHIVTDNPQVFREIIRGNGDSEANQRVASELNRWAKLLLRQVPHPFKENVKKLLGRGESWLYVIHNNGYDPEDDNDMPVSVINLDPLIVFPDRGEKNGVPSRMIVCYDRIAGDVQANYPYWTWKNRKNGLKETDKIPFFMYWDTDVRYFEADSEPLLTDLRGKPSNGDGIQENIYGIAPFVHAYSGFGEGSADGDPVNLAVSRLRKCRSLIGEYTAMRSTVNHIIFQYAHPNMDLMYDPQQWTPPPDFAEKYDRSPGAFNMVPKTQNGDLKRGVDMLPDQQLFMYLAKLEQDIDREDPLGTIDQAIGSSGRQQQQATDASLQRFKTIIDNCSHAFSVAFGIGLRMIERIPRIKPSGIKENDIAGYYQCRVELASKDPLENDRLRTLGERLYLNGQIDLETNLVKYQGYTVEDAQAIMAKILVDNATRNNPIIAQIMGEQAAREIGMEQQYQALKAQAGMMETTKPLPQTGSQGGEPRVGNIQSPQGMEMADMNLAQRGQRRMPA